MRRSECEILKFGMLGASRYWVALGYRGRAIIGIGRDALEALADCVRLLEPPL
jgi:hypothetical protein